MKDLAATARPAREATSMYFDAYEAARERCDQLAALLDNATKIGAYLAGLDCNSPAEERLAEIRKEAGLDA